MIYWVLEGISFVGMPDDKAGGMSVLPWMVLDGRFWLKSLKLHIKAFLIMFVANLSGFV